MSEGTPPEDQPQHRTESENSSQDAASEEGSASPGRETGHVTFQFPESGDGEGTRPISSQSPGETSLDFLRSMGVESSPLAAAGGSGSLAAAEGQEASEPNQSDLASFELIASLYDLEKEAAKIPLRFAPAIEKYKIPPSLMVSIEFDEGTTALLDSMREGYHPTVSEVQHALLTMNTEIKEFITVSNDVIETVAAERRKAKTAEIVAKITAQQSAAASSGRAGSHCEIFQSQLSASATKLFVDMKMEAPAELVDAVEAYLKAGGDLNRRTVFKVATQKSGINLNALHAGGECLSKSWSSLNDVIIQAGQETKPSASGKVSGVGSSLKTHETRTKPLEDQDIERSDDKHHDDICAKFPADPAGKVNVTLNETLSLAVSQRCRIQAQVLDAVDKAFGRVSNMLRDADRSNLKSLIEDTKVACSKDAYTTIPYFENPSLIGYIITKSASGVNAGSNMLDKVAFAIHHESRKNIVNNVLTFVSGVVMDIEHETAFEFVPRVKKEWQELNDCTPFASVPPSMWKKLGLEVTHGNVPRLVSEEAVCSLILNELYSRLGSLNHDTQQAMKTCLAAGGHIEEGDVASSVVRKAISFHTIENLFTEAQAKGYKFSPRELVGSPEATALVASSLRAKKHSSKPSKVNSGSGGGGGGGGGGSRGNDGGGIDDGGGGGGRRGRESKKKHPERQRPAREPSANTMNHYEEYVAELTKSVRNLNDLSKAAAKINDQMAEHYKESGNGTHSNFASGPFATTGKSRVILPLKFTVDVAKNESGFTKYFSRQSDANATDTSRPNHAPAKLYAQISVLTDLNRRGPRGQLTLYGSFFKKRYNKADWDKVTTAVAEIIRTKSGPLESTKLELGEIMASN